MLSLSVHDAFTRGQSLLFKCHVVSGSEFKSLCSVLNCIIIGTTNTVQPQILHNIFLTTNKTHVVAIAPIPSLLKTWKTMYPFKLHKYVFCNWRAHVCELTVPERICITGNQVVFENSSLCKTKAPRFVIFLKRPFSLFISGQKEQG